jgi:hypothetical protein
VLEAQILPEHRRILYKRILPSVFDAPRLGQIYEKYKTFEICLTSWGEYSKIIVPLNGANDLAWKQTDP